MTAAKKLAREYELIYILTPQTSHSDAEALSARLGDIVARAGGKLTQVDHWGRRRLAYPIGKNTRGTFVYVRFVGFGDAVAELERNLRIIDSVIRFQTVRLEGLYDLDALDVDPDALKFLPVEDTSDDTEPSFEERLGMVHRPRPASAFDYDEADDEGRDTDTRAQADSESAKTDDSTVDSSASSESDA